MEKYENKNIKVKHQLKKNSNINSKNTLDLKQGNQTLITKNNKNNKKTEVTTKITTKDINRKIFQLKIQI